MGDEAPATISAAVDHLIAQLTEEQRRSIAALERSQLVAKLHHGCGTWLRNTLLVRGDPRLVAECIAVVTAENHARVARDPVLSASAARLEALRPAPNLDDCSTVIIERLWETLRGSYAGPT